MRLSEIHLEAVGPIRNTRIPIAPLTILVGSNGTGKTSTLDAIEGCFNGTVSLGSSISSRVKPWNRWLAVAILDVDHWRIPAHFEQELVRRTLWAFLQLRTGPAAVAQFGSRDFVKEPIERIPSYEQLEAECIGWLKSGEQYLPNQFSSSAESLAKDLFKNIAFAFGRSDSEMTRRLRWGVCTTTKPSDLGPAFQALLDYFEEEYADNDYRTLSEAVAALADGGVGFIADFDNEEDGFAPQSHELRDLIRPTIRRMDLEPEDLEKELEESIELLAKRIVGNDMGTIATFGEPSKFVPSSWLISPNLRRDLDGKSAAWIVSPAVADAANRISSHLQGLLPTFIRELGEVQVVVRTPDSWTPGSRRVRVEFIENGESLEIDQVGSGVARWIALATRLACAELLAARRIGSRNPRSPNLSWLPEETDLEREVRRRAHNDEIYQLQAWKIDPNELANVRFETSGSNTIVLIDEPEAHLHPRAVRSIARWLRETSTRVSAVVVATHNPELINIDSLSSQKVLFRRDGDESRVTIWDGIGSNLDAFAESFGLTAADLLQLSRLMLFVEGPHDEIVLRCFFGDVLDAAGVTVLVLHGAKNASMILESEIVVKVGIPVGVLVDNADVEKVKQGTRTTYEESLIGRLLREWAAKDREIKTFGLLRGDIIEYLDPSVCSEVARRPFRDWRSVRSEYDLYVRHLNESAPNTKGLDFKRWVAREYGLTFSRDSIEDLALKTRERILIPDEMTALVASLVMAATNLSIE
jgi:hypothetical protein